MAKTISWTSTVAVGVVLIASGAGAAHNFLGVMDAVQSEVSLGGLSESVRISHCDSIYQNARFCFEQSPLNGFAYLDGRNLQIHTWCTYDIREPDRDVNIETRIASEHYTDESGPVCGAFVKAGETFQGTQSANEEVNAPDVPNTVVAEPIDAWTRVQYAGGGSVTESISWFQSWIKDAPMRSPATLEDGSGEAYYHDVRGNASTYVIADPSGDDRLLIDGVEVAVTDGVPVTTGDVKITRTDAPDGKNWTIEHTEDLPFAARIKTVETGRETRIKTFQV